MIKLGVNIDHIATLRQARMEGVPDIIRAAASVKAGGADGITFHLRQDRRHIQDSDVYSLAQADILPLNMEMAAADEIIAIALEVKPSSVCIVPENREELTTEGGLDIVQAMPRLKQVVSELKSAGIEVSMFIEPDEGQLNAANKCGADAVELHTGSYANADGDKVSEELSRLANALNFGSGLGLKVNAGHGLNYDNVGPLRDIQGFREFNIGYSIVCEAVFAGIEEAVGRMKGLLS
jgi:pyridoxine 5-phosphate synthase